MAWIESHQELGDHPKTRKLARLLGASRPAVVGHMHYLWWWATDYADDGDLTRFDPLDIATGAEWDGDETAFVEALVTAGFLDRADDGALTIHDWHEYAGKLIERRRANALRMREARATQETKPKKERASHVQRTQQARVERQNQTIQNTTKEIPPPTPLPGGVKPFDFVLAVCEEIGQDASSMTKGQRGEQCKHAEVLIADGASEQDIRSMTRWLAPQDWVVKGGGVDLKLIRSQFAKWQMNGKPNGPPRLASINGTRPRAAAPSSGVVSRADGQRQREMIGR